MKRIQSGKVLQPLESYIPPGMPVPKNPYTEFTDEELEQSIADRFEKQVRSHPRRLAVKTDHHKWTYDALNRAANRLAHAILALGGDPGAPVAFLVQDGAAQIIALLAILKAGRMYTALDSAVFPPDGLSMLLEHAQAGLLVTDNAHLTRARELNAGKRPLVNLDLLDAGLFDENPGLSVSPDAPALLLWTFGSTGQPRGVLHSHRNLLFYCGVATNWMHASQNDRLCLLNSCSFADSLGSIYPALLNGAALYPCGLQGPALTGLARWLIEQEITICSCLTSAFRDMIETLTAAESFPRLRILSLGGDPVTRKDVEGFRKHFSPACLLGTCLGAAEMITVCGQFLDRDTPVPRVWVPLGYPGPGVDVLLLNEKGEEVARGEVGEIFVRSRYLALSYWRDAERTEAAFRRDPAEERVRVCGIGALGLVRSDGCLEYKGRKDAQLKVGGQRIDVAEVKTALLEVVNVKQAVVVGWENDTGGKQLLAYVVPTSRPGPAVGDLRKALAETFPGYVPPAAFVFLDSLPRTPNGSVDRQALLASVTARPTLANPYVAARGRIEALLVKLWEECLHVRPVGVQDNFFDLGGDSLLAAEMLSRIESALGKGLSPATLLKGATVEKLTKALLQFAPAQPLLEEVQGGDPGRRFFYLHGDLVGGGAYCARLARLVGEDQPFYVLHPHGVVGKKVPQSIKEMAADYVRELLAVQSEGPYLLGGFCNGAVTAFEMACQLRQRGRRIDLLVLVAPPPLEKLKGTPAVGKTQPPWFTLPVGACFVSAVNQPDSAGAPVDVRALEGEERLEALFEAYKVLLCNYLPPNYPGRLILIQPTEDARLFGPAWRTWRLLAKEVENHFTPGTHEMALHPCAESLADILRGYLRKAARAETVSR